MPWVKKADGCIAQIDLSRIVNLFTFPQSPNMSSGPKKKSRSSRNETKSRGEDNAKWSEWSEWEWSDQKRCWMRTRANSNGLLLFSTIIVIF